MNIMDDLSTALEAIENVQTKHATLSYSLGYVEGNPALRTIVVTDKTSEDLEIVAEYTLVPRQNFELPEVSPPPPVPATALSGREICMAYQMSGDLMCTRPRGPHVTHRDDNASGPVGLRTWIE